MDADKYIGIKVWGQYMGSLGYFMQYDQRRASEENAPADATFQDYEGRWHTIRDLHETHAVRSMYRDAGGLEIV